MNDMRKLMEVVEDNYEEAVKQNPSPQLEAVREIARRYVQLIDMDEEGEFLDPETDGTEHYYLQKLKRAVNNYTLSERKQ